MNLSRSTVWRRIQNLKKKEASTNLQRSRGSSHEVDNSNEGSIPEVQNEVFMCAGIPDNLLEGDNIQDNTIEGNGPDRFQNPPCVPDGPDVNGLALALGALAMKHKWTNDCVDDVIKLLAHHNDLKNEGLQKATTSSRSLETNLGIKKFNLDFGWVCNKCGQVYTHSLFDNPTKKIKCLPCQTTPGATDSSFVLMSVREILLHVLPTIKFKKNLIVSPCLTPLRKKTKWTESEQNITLILNTDGVPLYTSSKCSFWPILATINEAEFDKGSVLMLGIWVGRDNKSKPDFDIFLKPIVDQIKILGESALIWKTLENQASIRTRVFILCVLCDSIGRPAVQKIMQFNAGYGCPYCLHNEPGHYYSHKISDPRSHESHLEHCEFLKTSLELGRTGPSDYYGVRGLSVLSILPYFDLIKGFPPDLMHAVYLGVARQLTVVWLEAKVNEPFYILQECRDELDLYFRNIKPPYRMSRLPRSIFQWYGKYKAHEWQAWLLYYSPIILEKCLNEDYFGHWMLLVQAISILTSDVINNHTLETAKCLLNTFSNNMFKLYGRKQCTFNVHLLLHLSEFSKYFGPLQHVSMFAFESYNMTISNFVTGFNFASSQIAKRYITQVIVHYNTVAITKGEVTAQFLRKMKRNYAIAHTVVGNIKLFDKAEYRLSDTETRRFGISNDQNVSVYKRIVFNKKMIHSSLYLKVTQRNSTAVLLKCNRVLEIYCFLLCTDKNVMAKGTVHEVQELYRARNRHLTYMYISKSSADEIVSVTEIVDIVLKIQHDNKTYFLKFVNSVDNNSS